MLPLESRAIPWPRSVDAVPMRTVPPRCPTVVVADHGAALGRGVSGRVVGRHPVAVGGAGRKPRIGVARPRRRCDEAAVAVDPVACHRHIVRRGRPGQIDPGRGNHRGLQVRGNRWGRGIQRRDRHRRALRRRIARRIVGRHAVTVARDLGKPRVGIARPVPWSLSGCRCGRPGSPSPPRCPSRPSRSG